MTCINIKEASHIEVRNLRIENCRDVGIRVSSRKELQISNILIVRNSIYHSDSSSISAWGVLPWNADPGDYQRISNIRVVGNTIERSNEGWVGGAMNPKTETGWNEQITFANGVNNFVRDCEGNAQFKNAEQGDLTPFQRKPKW